MPATISVNFTTQAEVLGISPPATKSVSASVLRSVLDTGGGGSGYVTVASAQTITGAKTFSAAIAGTSSNFSSTITAGTGTNGYARLNNGSATNPGYLAWFTPDDIRRGYVGWQVGTSNDINFSLENGWGLNINSPSKPVLITGDLTVTGNTTGIIPVGAVMGFFTNAAPAGWLRLNGAATLLRSQYPNLWAHAQASGNIVTLAEWNAGRYGSFHTGDTTTTFGIPFTEGFFLRGFSFGNVWDAGRVIGSYQADGVANHSHPYSDYYQVTGRTVSTGSQGLEQNSGGARSIPTSIFETGASTPRSTTSTTGSVADTRPKNVPILYCIKF